MKCLDFATFKKKFQETRPLIALVISKDSHKKVLDLCSENSQHFDSESFKQSSFLSEVETLPLLGKKRFITVTEVDALSGADLEIISTYVKNPNPFIHLLLTASSTVKFAKDVEEKGLVLQLSEKPWEKEKALIEWIIQYAAQWGHTISQPVAKKLALLKDEEILEKEIEKLICYLGVRKEITFGDLDAVALVKSQETFWNLVDALLKMNYPLSLQIGKDLLDETQLIALIALLKGQIKSSLEMIEILEKEGEMALVKSYPYLKGNLLEKKVTLLRQYGKNRLKRAFLALMECEAKAKNGSTNPSLLLEILTYQLCHFTSSPIS